MANELNTNDALNKDGTELIDKLVGINFNTRIPVN